MTQTANQKTTSPGILPNAGSSKRYQMPAGNPTGGQSLVAPADVSASVVVLVWGDGGSGGGSGAWGGFTGTLSDQADLQAVLDVKLESGDLVGYATESYVDASIAAIDLSGYATDAELASHVANTSNPHNVTAAQVGAIGGSTGSTDNCILRADGTGGSTPQAGAPATIDDSGNLVTSGLVASYGSSVAIQYAPNSMASGTITLASVLGYVGIWAMGVATARDLANYSFLDVGGTAIFNAQTGQNVFFRIANANAMQINSSRRTLVGPTLPTDDGVSALQVGGSVALSGLLTKGALTVATLPTAATNAGKEAQVTDSTVAAAGNYGATVSGGGSNRVKVFCNGTNWVIA